MEYGLPTVYDIVIEENDKIQIGNTIAKILSHET